MIPSAGTKSRFTLDTNILVYSVHRSASEKHHSAIQIIERAADRDCWLTLQAISEFFFASTRKNIVARDRAATLAQQWLTIFPCISATPATVRAALTESLAGRLSYWDALLVSTAASAGCTVILSEDMQDGATIAGVEIHNPFAADGGLTERTRTLLELGLT